MTTLQRYTPIVASGEPDWLPRAEMAQDPSGDYVEFQPWMDRMQWRSMDTAPRDGTPVLLIARATGASAASRCVGWCLPQLGWIEQCFSPNNPVGLEPTAWMPLPEPPK